MDPAFRLPDGRAQLCGPAIGTGEKDRTWSDAQRGWLTVSTADSRNWSPMFGPLRHACRGTTASGPRGLPVAGVFVGGRFAIGGRWPASHREGKVDRDGASRCVRQCAFARSSPTRLPSPDRCAMLEADAKAFASAFGPARSPKPASRGRARARRPMGAAPRTATRPLLPTPRLSR